MATKTLKIEKKIIKKRSPMWPIKLKLKKKDLSTRFCENSVFHGFQQFGCYGNLKMGKLEICLYCYVTADILKNL